MTLLHFNSDSQAWVPDRLCDRLLRTNDKGEYHQVLLELEQYLNVKVFEIDE